MFGSNFTSNFGIPTPESNEPAQAGSPLANSSPLAADQAAMSPETFANPAVSQVLGNLGKTAANVFLAPGRALASEQPITSEEMIKPAADTASFMTLGAGAMPAEANALRAGASVPKSSGFQALEDVRFSAEQNYIKENLPAPTGHLPPVDYVKHYTKNMSPNEVLESDALWAKATAIQDARSRPDNRAPFSQAFSDLASAVLGRPLTSSELSKAMTDAAGAGIGK
jgi:hypothetical protein